MEVVSSCFTLYIQRQRVGILQLHDYIESYLRANY